MTEQVKWVTSIDMGRLQEQARRMKLQVASLYRYYATDLAFLSTTEKRVRAPDFKSVRSTLVDTGGEYGGGRGNGGGIAF
ncbi:hypothetical protein NKR23_g5728 [Pleurostoma richardsiae]|uniref:Uncharacterized protein n=1 Tax=Pleurostoma richardsiae TaxID=41990 RepID=A0AA38RG15_9PEZI|nr:hypothetical protein NKR23_g5728 [Pleurostoma richardsiae]